ncbi:hypothetical protein GCM10007390_33190 [Persicitalea jodogahamensis]|uniref:histidine kinase n=2 Tax=Persicitalea jodogahamensis TaxID=402147 RepID=A0A8J3G9N4_9BACT|nr:hypothetical protein GCM10007390_33190 [Persicitalea jodogahamensis]
MAAGGLYFAEKGGANRETYLDAVQHRVADRLVEAQGIMDQVLGLLPPSGDKPFTDLLLESHLPYFLYKDSTLLMWSDYRYVFDQRMLAAPPNETSAVTTPQGQFLLLTKYKETGGSRYRLFALIPLHSTFGDDKSIPGLAYNTDIFHVAPQSLSLQTGGEPVVGPNGNALFYIVSPDAAIYQSRSVPQQSLWLVSLAMLLLGVHVVLSVRFFKNRHRYGLGLALLLAFMLLVRWLMLRFSIPLAFHESTIFNPQNYQGSPLAPSLGDLLLNCVCVLFVLMYVNGIYFRTITYRLLARSGGAFQTLFSLLILMVGYVAYYLYYLELVNIYEKSLFTLDITLSIHFSALKISSLAVFVILSAIYFMVVHLVVSLFIRLTPNRITGLAVILSSALLAALMSWFLGIHFEWIFPAHLAYILILYLSRLTRSFYGFRYPTTVYYFLGAMVCAVMATFVVEKQEARKDTLNKKEFGRRLVSDNDLYTEFLLGKTGDVIVKDPELITLLSGKVPLAREIIRQRVKTNYLDDYLNQYDVEVIPFDSAGKPLDSVDKVQDYAYYRNKYARPAIATANPTVFLASDMPPLSTSDTVSKTAFKPGNRMHYISFVRFGVSGQPTGYIVLDLRQRRSTPLSRNPELILDDRFIQTHETREYSYAIYEKGQQLYSNGTFNYERKFPTSNLKNPELYQNGLTLSNYRHVGEMGTRDRVIVVSSKAWELRGLLANFSFLYLILVVVVSLVILAHALRYGFMNLPLTFSTKIQVLLNAAFILPLLIVLFFVLRVISDNYKENQKNAHLDNSRNLSANVLSLLDNYEQSRMSQAYFGQQIQQIARDADLDINLYDTTGHLILSSQPLVYQSGLISKLINPLARKQIIEQKEYQVLLDESLGRKEYSTAYTGLKSYDQQLLGILSIPYFDAKPSLDRQIIDIVASVLIVFTVMLLVFLFVSYVAANLLIDPLRVLTKKISTTNLDQLNEPLPWHSNDEIGTLIKKYNKMLLNLDMSKQTLSSTEKQSAWRDMARQVAHEIKNPLTPMKLKIQQLQRTIRRDDPEALAKVNLAMESIIEQIDNIGYIAQSFSDIAKMPPPQNEVFEVTGVLNKAYELHSNDKSLAISREFAPGPLFVSGDSKQFGASINNLIINAQQSVPESRLAEIVLKLYTHNDTVIVEVKDNGSGIAQNIRSRVFLPNFTTREDGTGLGLAMAKRIIEYAGGSIWFETEEGTGTTFFLSLPLAEPI